LEKIHYTIHMLNAFYYKHSQISLNYTQSLTYGTDFTSQNKQGDSVCGHASLAGAHRSVITAQ